MATNKQVYEAVKSIKNLLSYSRNYTNICKECISLHVNITIMRGDIQEMRKIITNGVVNNSGVQYGNNK